MAAAALAAAAAALNAAVAAGCLGVCRLGVHYLLAIRLVLTVEAAAAQQQQQLEMWQQQQQQTETRTYHPAIEWLTRCMNSAEIQ